MERERKRERAKEKYEVRLLGIFAPVFFQIGSKNCISIWRSFFPLKLFKTDLYHLHFFLIFVYLYLLETLIFWTKCYYGNPLFQGFVSLSKRFTNPSLPHRGSAESRPHLPLPRDKVVLTEAPSARMVFSPCPGCP